MRAKRLVLSRWWNHLPLLLCFASTLWLLRPSAFSQPSGAPLAACQTPTVVSLATTAKRLADGRLQTTLRSLLRQALPCAPRIWLWVPDTDRQAAEAAVPHLQRLVAGVWRRQRGGPPPPAAVVLRLVPDAGPASKFLHAVAALSWPDGTWQSPPPGSVFALGGGAAGAAGTSAQEQQAQWRAAADDRAALAGAADAHLFVVDDDQYYAPDALPTLLSWRGRLRRAVLSCRGWRVREDGAWGVPPGEFDRHVVEGWRLAEPYQVGVSTANKVYLLCASLLRGMNLSNYAGAPPEARLVDDIWLNGHMAAAGIPRYVVPLPSASHELPGPSTLDALISGAGSRRAAANNAVLRHFRAAFEAEGIPYHLSGSSSGGGGRVGDPRWRPAWQRGLVRLREALLAARLRLFG